ncbi:MAG: lycopene cyclase domain-containing protein [Verrucomicrobiia bacterium]
MTYRRFHLYFNLPLLIILSLLARPHWNWHDSVVTIGLCLIVLIFTTPWDNWAVKRNLWNFPKEKILFRIFYCPVEEYLFFLTQTVQACLLTDIFRSYFFNKNISLPAPNFRLASALALVWVVFFFLSKKISRPLSLTYLWHLLFWMLPVVFFQWTLGGFWIQQFPLVISTTLSLGTSLWIFDLVAVHQKIWFFDERQTLNLKLFRLLPLEEMLFFYLTTLMVVQGFLLFI